MLTIKGQLLTTTCFLCFLVIAVPLYAQAPSPASTPSLISTPQPQITQSPLQTPAPSPVYQLQPQPKDFMDYFLALIQVFTLFGLGLYVYKTWEIASATRQSAEASRRATELSQDVLAEMKKARDEESAPYVVVYFDVFPERDIMDLVVKNIGKTIARNVKFEFTPPLVSSEGKIVSETHLVKNGIGSIPPGHEIRVLFDTPLYYFSSQEDEEKLPLMYQVKVTYTGGINSEERILESNLDVSPYIGFSYLQQKGLHELVKALEKLVDPSGNVITSRLDNLVETLKSGIWLKNTEFLTNEFPDVSDDWPRIAASKLSEFKFIWTSVYGGDTKKLVNPFLNNLKANCFILSSQILKIATKAPSNMQGDVIGNMLDIASKLSELSTKKFYIGGQSSNSFDSQGTEIVNIIDEAIKKLSTIEIGNTSFKVEPDAETNEADSAIFIDNADEEKT